MFTSSYTDMCEHKRVKNCEASRFLPDLQANKLVCCCFMDAGTKQETPGPEMKDDLLLTVRAEVRVAGLVPFLQLSSHVVIQRGPGDTYTRGWFYHKRGTV